MSYILFEQDGYIFGERDEGGWVATYRDVIICTVEEVTGGYYLTSVDEQWVPRERYCSSLEHMWDAIKKMYAEVILYRISGGTYKVRTWMFQGPHIEYPNGNILEWQPSEVGLEL